MYPATRASKITPGSNLQRWLSTALAEFELFTTFMAYITEEELTSFWGRCKFADDAAGTVSIANALQLPDHSSSYAATS
jgi:hypothetical protein